MQLVVPSAVSAADMMLAIICKMVFQVSFFIVRVCVVVTTYCPFNVEHSPLFVMSSTHPFFVERLPSICHVERSRDISRPLGRLAKPKYLLRRFKRSLHSLRSVEMTRGEVLISFAWIVASTTITAAAGATAGVAAALRRTATGTFGLLLKE